MGDRSLDDCVRCAVCANTNMRFLEELWVNEEVEEAAEFAREVIEEEGEGAAEWLTISFEEPWEGFPCQASDAPKNYRMN